MRDESLLQRMQLAVGGEALDSRDLDAILHHGKGQARDDAASVDEHGAGATLAVVATFLSSGEVEILAERVEQRSPRSERQAPLDAVDAKRDVELRRRLELSRVLPLIAQRHPDPNLGKRSQAKPRQPPVSSGSNHASQSCGVGAGEQSRPPLQLALAAFLRRSRQVFNVEGPALLVEVKQEAFQAFHEFVAFGQVTPGPAYPHANPRHPRPAYAQASERRQAYCSRNWGTGSGQGG